MYGKIKVCLMQEQFVHKQMVGEKGKNMSHIFD